MDASRVSSNYRALRPLAVVGVAGLLLTGAACNGPLARRAARRQTVPVTAVAPSTTTVAAVTPTQAVRTDDLDAGLQQADSQLAQTGAAVGDADQNPQQTSD